MNILGIETSCDETAAAVVRDGRDVLANVVFSQVDLHRPYGGVVPEVASRSHVTSLPDVIREAIERSGLGWQDIDAVAVTYGPGLASSLLVGLSSAKALAMRLGKPLIGINHLQAHIHSLFIGRDSPDPREVCPFIALVVSGGHTCLVRVEAPGRYVLLGQTMDDAAGEAFDKGANMLGLGYPGGPAIDRVARSGRADYVKFPRGRQLKDTARVGGLDVELCCSFSGLKTSLLYYLRDHPLSGERSEVPSIAASYQEAIVDTLVDRCRSAMRGERCLAAVGGVSLNGRLRTKLGDYAKSAGFRFLLAEPQYCADNAAMVAGLAGTGQGVSGPDVMSLDVDPNLDVA
ncbi:MAG: tRNA (adenosine(37)-N6)-threonylcarbamoyltransferase complex transferase subunit TsaD [bacterium]